VNDILSLFLSDLTRSMEGLRQSIDLGPDGMAQASLHARDLADALQSVDLPRHAEIALVVSRHLAAGRPGTEQFTLDLLELVRQAIDALSSGDEGQQFPNQDQVITALARAVSLFGEQPVDFSSPAFLMASDSSRVPPSESPSDQTEAEAAAEGEDRGASESEGVIDLEDVTGLMYFAGQEAESPMARIPISSDLSGPDASALPRMTMHDRLYALKSLQALDHEISRTASPELSHQVRLRLSDHANWLMGLAQEPLQRRLVGMSRTLELAGVWADADVIDYLISAMSVLPQSSSIRGSTQHQTLFVELTEVRSEPDELERASRILQILAGRIDSVGDGLRLVLPSSLSRLRVVPFRRAGLMYAISWAQFLKAEAVKSAVSDVQDLLGDVTSPRLVINLKSGSDVIRIHADEIHPFEVANAFLLPPAVEAPDWTAGVLVGPSAEPLVWIVPSNA
jgi:hypothetical protein